MREHANSDEHATYVWGHPAWIGNRLKDGTVWNSSRIVDVEALLIECGTRITEGIVHPNRDLRSNVMLGIFE